jgi:SHS2 domain-containing protein
MSKASGWEHFEHGADIGVRGYGLSLSEAFAQAARALIAVITDPELIESREQVTIECHAADPELLLVDWLNAIVYEMAVRNMLFSRFDVVISDNNLQATIWGEPVSGKKHQPVVEVKGATYTELRVRQESDGVWLAQCIVDV